MNSQSSDILFELIKSLQKAEKRHFKLYITRSSSNENLKIVQLFDAIDKLAVYDEKTLLKKLPSVQKTQLSNLKAHLYKQILASLRLLKSSDSLDLQLNEQFDYAHILYKKGLFQHSLRILDKAKELAKANQKIHFIIQAVGLEKRIEGLHVTKSAKNRIEELTKESTFVSEHISKVTALSNLSLNMYDWFVKHGHAMNEKDEESVTQYMQSHLPEYVWYEKGFYERMYLYQSFTWYYFIRQNFLMYYRYAKKWVELFNEHPLMKRVETSFYIKGMHYLLNAHFDLRNANGLDETLKDFEDFSMTDRVQDHENFRIQCFIYITQGKMNRYSITGDFKEGIKHVPEIIATLDEYSSLIDRHHLLVLNYKIAQLYFGIGDYETCIDYLNKIINSSTEIRYDLQAYARLLHMLAHFELGNHQLVEYLSKSVYRFMAKMKNFTVIEEQMFRFLRKSFKLSRSEIRNELQQLLDNIKELEHNRFETRTFAYLDVISWLEGRLSGRTMSEVIADKFRHLKRK